MGQHLMFKLKQIACAVTIAIAILPAGAARAGFVSGWDLLQICKANPNHAGFGILSAQCRGYVTGVADTFDCTNSLHGFHWDSTITVERDELVAKVIQWFNAHPKTLRHEADGLIAAALGETYPCK